jgi:PAS domain S-box-containing protein
MLGLPLCFATLSLAWLNLSDTLLRIAAPDAEMMPLLRALNYFVFVALSTLAWSGWVLRERATHRRRETLNRTLLEQAPTPLALARRGRVVACNPAFARLLGVPDPEAGRGEALLTHVHPDARAPLLDHIRELDARAPRTTRIDTTVTDRQGGRQALALLLRRFRAGRESMDVVACLPPDPMGEALAVRDDLGLQLLERLPRPVWIWTPHGLCLWRNAAAGEENRPAVRVLQERYGSWHEGSRFAPAAARDVLQPALAADTGAWITVTAGSKPAPIQLWVLPISDRQGHVQAVAAVVDSPTIPEGDAMAGSTIVRGLEIALRQAVTERSPDGLARALLTAFQQHVGADRWVALLQVDLARRRASFWSLTGLGVPDHATATLPPDLPAECGPAGRADIATLTHLESLPPILAQMERAGIDRFERIRPEHPLPGHLQSLMIAGPAQGAAPLTRSWANVTFSLAALLLQHAPEAADNPDRSRQAEG